MLKVHFSLLNFTGSMDWDVVWSVVANICAFHHYMENGLGQRGTLKYICEVIFMN
jgi:hypothetical protein